MAVMAVIRLFSRSKARPADDKPVYEETEILHRIGEWLSHLETEEEQFRALTYWMWRVKSKDHPTFGDWQDSIAEQSAEIVGGRTGFGEKQG